MTTISLKCSAGEIYETSITVILLFLATNKQTKAALKDTFICYYFQTSDVQAKHVYKYFLTR